MIPKLIKPMLAFKAPKPFDSEKHIFEVKLEGIRTIAFVENGKLRLQSRGLRDITSQFPELLDLPNQLKGDRIVLDGEIVVLKEGKPSFKEIQSRIQTTNSNRIKYSSVFYPATYLVFDLLYKNGKSLMAKPLMERKARLNILLERTVRARAISFVEKEGIRLFQQVKAQGLEGVMAKRKEGLYYPGKRTREWQKFK